MVTVDELAAEVAALRRRVDLSESVLEIQAMKARYADLVDQRFSKGAVVDPANLDRVAHEIAAMFTLDGVWDGGPGLGISIGRPAIARQLCDTTFSFSRHFFVNPRIVVDGEKATGRWDLLSPCRRASGGSFWVCGIEDDEYRQIDGTWLHQSMRFTTVVMTPVDEGWTKIFI